MKTLAYWLLTLFVLPGLRAQSDTFRLALSLPVEARFATADNLGNIYLIDTQNALEKYNPDGRLLSRYSNNRLGGATSIDVANPLKILVWYADFRTVVFLDRNMTALGELYLMEAGIPELRTIAAAADGNLWLYDEIAFQLKKITPAGSLLFESQALNQLATVGAHPSRTDSSAENRRIGFATIRDDGEKVLASDPAAGIFWFDSYGQLQQILPWTGVHRFILDHHDQLEYLDGDSLHIENLRFFATQNIPLPAQARQPGAQRWLASRHLLVQNGKELEVWARL